MEAEWSIAYTISFFCIFYKVITFFFLTFPLESIFGKALEWILNLQLISITTWSNLYKSIIHINIPGHPWVLQTWDWLSFVPRLPLPFDNSQPNPPFEGAGLVHVLVFVCVPPPQDTVQVLYDTGQDPQLPLTKNYMKSCQFTKILCWTCT